MRRSDEFDGDNFDNSEVMIKPYSDALRELSESVIIDDSEVVSDLLVNDIVLPNFYSSFAMAETI